MLKNSSSYAYYSFSPAVLVVSSHTTTLTLSEHSYLFFFHSFSLGDFSLSHFIFPSVHSWLLPRQNSLYLVTCSVNFFLSQFPLFWCVCCSLWAHSSRSWFMSCMVVISLCSFFCSFFSLSLKAFISSNWLCFSVIWEISSDAYTHSECVCVYEHVWDKGWTQNTHTQHMS